MSFCKRALLIAFAAGFCGWLSPAAAQNGDLASPGGVVLEVYVHGDEVEIVCPTTECNARCRDIEGTQLLLAGTFYRIGANCSITITDGTLLQEAMETILALTDITFPGAPQNQFSTEDQFLENTETNPNQNTIAPASPTTSTSP